MSDANRRATAAKTEADLQEDNLESSKLITSETKLENIIDPRLDYSDPSTFVTYGLAEKYYVAAVENITNIYPYDGSKLEKTEWHISGSGLDNYVFDNTYPRTNGSITLSYGGWGDTAASLDEYELPVDKEYITVYGGPNADSMATNLSSLFPSAGGKANVINALENQEANLTIGGGNTVEFWMKKPTFEKAHEVVLDVMPNQLVSDDRFCIYLSSSGHIGLKYKASSSEVSGEFPVTGLDDDNWHHYAISITPSGAATLYIDGAASDDEVTGDATTKVETPLVATLGSYAGPKAADGTTLPTDTPGWCKLDASLDEFRFWKTDRSGIEIGINWNTQVYGGTNTDTANTDLGVYFKFNEGILGTSQDATVLDFSGRISNGAWTGYSPGARSLTSAMVESGASVSEFKDPIIYSTHPDVKALKERLRVDGLLYDQQNNASLYNSVPSWIREEDTGTQNTMKLMQIMSSYLDTLQNQLTEINQIKNISYPSGSQKPYNIINRNLRNLGFETEDFFIDATLLERFMDRNNQGDLELKITDTKNLIYQNIYNNLTYIMSSKGTEKSFRNLVRCFGVDERLVKLNVYSNGEIYTLEDRYATSVFKKRMISFDDTTRFEATIFQTSSATTPSLGYISSSGDFANLNGVTLEADILFPSQAPISSPDYYNIPFKKASLFGMKETDGTTYDWLPTDNADLQVYAVREQKNGESAYFQLTSSQLGIDLKTDVYGGVYDNERWIFAAKVKNPAIDTDEDYVIEFQGSNANNGIIQNSFTLTASLDNTEALALLGADKRLFAGAYKTNFSGSTVEKTNVLFSALRYWGKYLNEDEITSHAKDARNFGLKDPNRPVFNAENDMPAIDTLKLHWDFELVNSSSTGGEFDVLDFSGGNGLYGDFGNIHNGKGYGFPASSTEVVDVEYVNTLTRVNPDVANGSDMVDVLTPAEQIKEEFSQPTNLVFAIEKSLYQTLSDEMIRSFSTIKDFASLYNSAADKYRNKHAEMEIMRRNFFSKMENSPDVNKFYEYFKWIDDAVVRMLRQVLPAGAEVTEGSINIIEGHILERNKFVHKTPTYAVDKEINTIAVVVNVATNGGGSGIGAAADYSDPFWDGRPFYELPYSMESGDVHVDADRLRILNNLHSGRRKISQVESTIPDGVWLEEKSTASHIPANEESEMSSTGLVEQVIRNGKTKIFGKIVKLG